MGNFHDEQQKAVCQAECDKRNKSIGKHHPLRWKPLFEPGKGWKPNLRQAVEISHKPKGKLA